MGALNFMQQFEMIVMGLATDQYYLLSIVVKDEMITYLSHFQLNLILHFLRVINTD